MRQYWEKFSSKVNDLALRERVLIFAAVAFLLVTLVNTLFLDPLLVQQKKLAAQVTQQQEKMKEIQAQIEALLDAKKGDAVSPERARLSLLKKQIAEGDEYLKTSRERLVQPDKMAGVLEQVLNRNGNLQLVSLHTLPVTPLIEQSAEENGLQAAAMTPDSQVFKHGVQITVRGNYLDLMQYLAALERLPVQMFWGMAKMNVVKHPVAELTLTIYTLSLDKTWMLI